MKAWLVIGLFAAGAASAWAAESSRLLPAAVASASLSGEVLEVLEVPGFTYLRLKTESGETWAAVSKVPADKAKIHKGAKVTVENVSMMRNFDSKALKKTFDTLAFGNLKGMPATQVSPHGGVAGPHSAPGNERADVKVAKAAGPDARTVAEVNAKAAALAGKTVVVRGKVVKYNPGIMNKNWVHLRDGTGTAGDNSNDVLVTTTQATRVGDVVTVKGTVRTHQDLGQGYSFKVLIEAVSLQP